MKKITYEEAKRIYDIKYKNIDLDNHKELEKLMNRVYYEVPTQEELDKLMDYINQ